MKIKNIGIYLFFFGWILILSACQDQKNTIHASRISFDSLFTKYIIEQEKAGRDSAINQFLAQNQLADSTASFAYFLLGYVNYSEEKFDEANSNFRKSLSFLGEDETSEIRAINFHWLGNLALEKQQLYLANYYISQAAELIIQNNYRMKYPKPSAIIIAHAAILNQYNNSFANALKYAKSTGSFLENNPKIQEDIVSSQLVNAIIYSYPSMENPDSVEHYLDYALRLKNSFGIDSRKINSNIIYTKAAIFSNQEKFDSCLYYLSQIEAQDENGEFIINCNKILLYVELGKLDSAKYFLDLADANYKPAEESDELNYLENKTHYLIATNQSEEALATFKELMAKKLEKEVNENVKAVNELATVYSLQSKETKIKKLTQEVDAVQFTLARRNLYLIGLGILLLFSIIAIAFGISVSKRRKLESENERISALNNKVDLEQRLLRSQMDPHFIFNSLGAIQSFIRQEKKAESLSYLSLFSKLLRGNLESSRAKAITLESEVDLLENYLKLQQVRNPASFSYQISLSESAEAEKEDLEIPPMLIQPFVENAILHGVRGMESGGEISIQIDFSEDLLLVKVFDNGKGLTSKTNSNHNSHAINIVRERLEILEQLAQKPAKFSIQDRIDSSGVLVKLEIPLFH